MADRKQNEYGLPQLYETGDRVRVWPVFGRPIGTVEYVVDFEASPMKYRVRYTYEDGTIYSEEFASNDLTLYEKRYSWECNCNTSAQRHEKWCSAANERREYDF